MTRPTKAQIEADRINAAALKEAEAAQAEEAQAEEEAEEEAEETPEGEQNSIAVTADFQVNDKGSIVAMPNGWRASRGRAVAPDGSAYALVGPEGKAAVFHIADMSAVARCFYVAYGHGQQYGSDISLTVGKKAEKIAEVGKDGYREWVQGQWDKIVSRLTAESLEDLMARVTGDRAEVAKSPESLAVAEYLRDKRGLVKGVPKTKGQAQFDSAYKARWITDGEKPKTRKPPTTYDTLLACLAAMSGADTISATAKARVDKTYDASLKRITAELEAAQVEETEEVEDLF